MKKLLETILGEKYSKLAQISVDGKNWFRAKDVCNVLGLKNTSVAVRGGNVRIGYFGIERKDIFKLGNYKSAPLFISEYGIFKLILKSRKPAAFVIKGRLSERVLPEIIRTGEYQDTKAGTE